MLKHNTKQSPRISSTNNPAIYLKQTYCQTMLYEANVLATCSPVKMPGNPVINLHIEFIVRVNY